MLPEQGVRLFDEPVKCGLGRGRNLPPRPPAQPNWEELGNAPGCAFGIGPVSTTTTLGAAPAAGCGIALAGTYAAGAVGGIGGGVGATGFWTVGGVGAAGFGTGPVGGAGATRQTVVLPSGTKSSTQGSHFMPSGAFFTDPLNVAETSVMIVSAARAL